MEKGKKNFSLIKIFLLGMIFLCLFSFILPFCVNPDITSAADSDYSGVLSDLYIDDSFAVEEYPVDENDYSLQIITIAESTSGELFIYVYQPCSPNEDLVATTIRLSTGINNNALWKDYKLTLLNSEGVFGKYRVENFEVKKDAVRYYDVAAIHRNWNRKYDSVTYTSEVAYPIEKIWTASTVEDKVTYTCAETETIVITDKKVGLLRFWNGLHLVDNSTDSHYVAFSCDHEMDKLLEADVSYSWVRKLDQKGVFGIGNSSYDVDSGEDTCTLYYDLVESNPGGWFAHKYVWNQIESVDDFKKDKDLKQEAIDDLDGMEWVLNFLTTSYETWSSAPNPTSPLKSVYERYTVVSDVTILRLKFETDGVVYNLGVVDNKNYGTGIPDNKTRTWLDDLMDFLKKYWKIIVIVLAVILGLPLIIACMPLILWFVKAVAHIIIWIFKGLWWLITLPFKIFKKEDK